MRVETNIYVCFYVELSYNKKNTAAVPLCFIRKSGMMYEFILPSLIYASMNIYSGYVNEWYFIQRKLTRSIAKERRNESQ